MTEEPISFTCNGMRIAGMLHIPQEFYSKEAVYDKLVLAPLEEFDKIKPKIVMFIWSW